MPPCGPAAPGIPRQTPPLGSFTAQVASAKHRCVDPVARTVQSALSHSRDNPLLSHNFTFHQCYKTNLNNEEEKREENEMIKHKNNNNEEEEEQEKEEEAKKPMKMLTGTFGMTPASLRVTTLPCVQAAG